MSREDTRAKIIETFRELAATKSLDKITVLDISEKCGITSQTFYNHFSDKYDLVNTLHSIRFDEVCDNVRDRKITWGEGLVDYLKGYSVYSKFIMNAYGNIGDENSYMRKAVDHMVIKMCNVYEVRKDRPVDYELLFAIKLYAEGIMCTVYRWLRGDYKMSEQELADYIHKAIPKIIVDRFEE